MTDKRREIFEKAIRRCVFRSQVSPNNYKTYLKENINQALKDLDKLDLTEDEIVEEVAFVEHNREIAPAIVKARAKKRGK